MIAARPESPDRLRPAPHRPAIPEGAQAGASPAEDSTLRLPSFRPLDPGIVSEAIPAFFIGRNKDGFWVARNANGKIGGIFLFESSALSFARRKSRPKGCATIYQSGTFELDLKNRGNPFIAPIGRLKRLAIGHLQQAMDPIGKTTKALQIWQKRLLHRLKPSPNPDHSAPDRINDRE